MAGNATGVTTSSMDSLRQLRGRIKGSSKAIDEKVAEVPHMSVNEPALIHPWNQSIIKIRDNGSLDFFTGSDNGIRINPQERTIDIMSKTQTTHSTFVRAFVLKDEVRHIQKAWTIWAETATINTKKNTTINADGQCVVNSKKETMIHAEENLKLSTKKDLIVNAGCNTHFYTGGRYYFE